MKLQKQDEARDTETGTKEELEHGDDDEEEEDEEEEDLDFSPLAAWRKKPVKRQSRKTLSKQIIKSQ